MKASLGRGLVSVLLAVVPACGETLDLAGVWRLRLDPQDDGVAANWPARPLEGTDPIRLPNTTDLAGFGFPLDTHTMRHAAPFPVTTRFPGTEEPERADERGYLVRRFLWVGPAWYERGFEVPPAWQGRPITLRFERAMWQTEAWLDGQRLGACDSLVAAHRYELGALPPGRHRLTVRVDNRLIHNLSTITHAYGPETQSRWNGLIGSLQLEVLKPVAIRALTVFPAPDRRSVRVRVKVVNVTDQLTSLPLHVRLQTDTGRKRVAAVSSVRSFPHGESTMDLTLDLAQPAEAWDEFHPVRYRVTAGIGEAESPAFEVSTWFGFRQVERVGKELRLNGRPIFLRGTLDCAVYPKTGHPPMTVATWQRALEVVKAHGFNHVRFHTWCPPEAAFEAADRLGLYLQPEAPAWVDDWGLTTVTRPPAIGRDPAITEFLRAELRRMSEAYGNHPSFLLCAIGNEFGMQGTDWARVNDLVEEIKALDPRRLYTGCGARRHLPADDYWFTHQTGAPTRGVGPGHTDWDFRRAVETSPVPVIAHETGQRPVFPDYAALLPKFTGPLLPLNLDRYRRALDASGLAGQTRDFVRASARFQLTQYKAEHEAMLRTRGYAGYQLLMLNDFTGQSESLVGLLDPFREGKGVVSAADVRRWNAPSVLLARFTKYVWTADESFRAKLELAHFGDRELPAGPVRWSLESRRGAPIAQGRLRVGPTAVGRVADLGEVAVPLNRVREPTALRLVVRFRGVENDWPLWVYPPIADEPEPSEVLVTHAFDDAARARLDAGGKVLLLAHGLKNARAARTGFESVYWSAGWWGNQFSSLGLLCDPRHPALREFPNDGGSDWQWRDLCAGATTFDLTGAQAGLRPIVQLVPDFHFNTRLGQVFEARVGRGALLVSGHDLESDLARRPAARQFRRSLFRYAASDAFRPAVEATGHWLRPLLTAAGAGEKPPN